MKNPIEKEQLDEYHTVDSGSWVDSPDSIEGLRNKTQGLLRELDQIMPGSSDMILNGTFENLVIVKLSRFQFGEKLSQLHRAYHDLLALIPKQKDKNYPYRNIISSNLEAVRRAMIYWGLLAPKRSFGELVIEDIYIPSLPEFSVKNALLKHEDLFARDDGFLDFLNCFENKLEPPVETTIVRAYQINRFMYDADIRAKLVSQYEITVGQLFYLLNKRQFYNALIDHGGIFYVRDARNILRVLRCTSSYSGKYGDPGQWWQIHININEGRNASFMPGSYVITP